MSRYDPCRADSDARQTGGTMPEFGKPQTRDGVVVTDFAVIRETIRKLADRCDPEELIEAVEPMEG